MRSLGFARIRRALLATPGFSMKPVCKSCNKERDPKGFSKLGICAICTVEYDAAEAIRINAEIELIDRRLLLLSRAVPETTEQGRAILDEMCRMEMQRLDLDKQLHAGERSQSPR